MKYKVIIRPGEVSGYVVECPAIPGCVSQSATAEEAMANIKEAIKDCLEVLNKRAERDKLKHTRSGILAKGDKTKLKVVLEKGENGFIVVHCPSLKGCWSQGKTEQEAIENIKEAIALYLEPDSDDVKPSTNHKVLEVAV